MMPGIEHIPAWLGTMGVSALPVVELRGGIPLGMTVFGLPFWQAYLYAVLGNSLVAALWLLALKRLVPILMRVPMGYRFFTWWFERARKTFARSHEIYGALALLVFVAVPLPVTGVWTAAVAASLFEIRPRTALLAMFGGVCISGVVVGVLTGSLQKVF